MTNLYVDINRDCINDYWDGEQFGEWSRSWSNSLGWVTTNSKFYGDQRIPVDYEAKVGHTVYVLWAEWSTGDSFGSGFCEGCEVIHIFKSQQAAEEAKKSLLSDHPDYKGYKTDEGKLIPYYRPWNGYFESIEGMYIEAREVRE